MIKTQKILTICWFSLFVQTVQAASLSGNAAVRLEKRLDTVEQEEKRAVESISTTQHDTETFVLVGIVFDGLSVFESYDLLALYESHLGQSIDPSVLSVLARQIEQKYHQAGYRLARVQVPSRQDFKTGIVRATIFEGPVKRIRLTGVVPDDLSLVEAYLGKISLHKPFSQADIDKVYYLLNALPGLSVEYKLLAIEDRPGEFELVFRLSQRRFGAELSLDNRGSKVVGERLGVLTLNSYSGLQAHEHLQARVARSEDTDELNYLAIQSVWPMGARGGQLSTGLHYLDARPGDFLASSDIRVHAAGVFSDWRFPALLDRVHTLWINGRLQYYNSDTDAAALDIAEDELFTLMLGMQYRGVDVGRYSNRLVMEIHHALSGMNDTRLLTNAGWHSADTEDFTILKLTMEHERNLSPNLDLVLKARAQLASSGLPGSEVFALGGSDIGRGYDPAEVTGDHGLAGQVMMNYQLSRFALPKSKTWLYGFYDLGRAWSAVESERSSSASTGAGIRIGSRYVHASLEIALPLTRQVFLEGDDDARVFGSIQLRY